MNRAAGPSFPPVDALIDRMAAVDWHAVADRALTVALTVAAVAVALTRRALPLIARALRWLADRADRLAAVPAPAPRETVAQLRSRARRAGLSRDLYTFGRRTELIAALAGCAS
jgi:hypothetical protein